MSNPLSDLSNDEIVERLYEELSGTPMLQSYSVEMMRRLIVSIENLNIASSKYSKRLICLTWALIGLTIVIAGLTIKLALFVSN